MIAVLSSKIMTEPAWITRWRARDALKSGRPHEAHRLLDGLIARGDRRALALSAAVVRSYLEQAEKAVRHDQVDAAWNDVRGAEKLAPTDQEVVQLRGKLTQSALARIEAELEAGNALKALQTIGQLKNRPAQSPEIAPLEEAAQDWIGATEAAERGDFATARCALERVRRRLPNGAAGLDRFEQDLVAREKRFRAAWNDLQTAIEAHDWRNALQTADEVLAVAPRHRETQQARNRAWQIVQPATIIYDRPLDRGSMSTGAPVIRGRGDSAIDFASTVDGPEATLPRRFLLWIDGVGAWLVCLSSRISIGQAAPEGGPIDVPLLADVSRIHASLTRDDESYLLETSRDVLVNGQPMTKAVLQSGDRLSISSCSILFEQPVPGCLSARLSFDGNRRLPMAVDGVLLLADMLILGPGAKVHVPMEELTQPLHLFRQKERLGIRWPGEFVVEGEKCKDRALLPTQGTVSANEFTIAIEPIAK